MLLTFLFISCYIEFVGARRLYHWPSNGKASWTDIPMSRTSTVVINAARIRVNKCSFMCRLLDKLTVVCPNADSCQEKSQRGILEDHLKYRSVIRRLVSVASLKIISSTGQLSKFG
jgi:hypothetical protein